LHDAKISNAFCDGEVALLMEKPIECVKCGQGGGTLVKIGENRYVHNICPRKRIPPKLIISQKGTEISPEINPSLQVAAQRDKR
jgi:hypothetical protein